MLNTEFDWEAKRALKKVSVSRAERLYYESVQRWLLTAHGRASFVDRCREMASSHPQDEIKGHKESGSVRKRRDEEDSYGCFDL